MQVSLERFRDLVGRSRAPVKARLLNQQALAGVGNLLADEALWRAGSTPAAAASTSTPTSWPGCAGPCGPQSGPP
jgi:formamidopyrimidine-DNA glycosylase